MEEEIKKEDVCAKFSVGNFYSTHKTSQYNNRLQNKLVRVAETAKHIGQNPLPCTYQPGVLGPPSTWKTFPRQSEAIKYAQVQGEGLMVFSFEGDAVGNGGKRNFVVTHPALMWIRHRGRNPRQRCTYEVIQEHSVCKLYFDLEFLSLFNAERDGVTMTNIWIQIVCHFLQKEFNVLCSRTDIIDLSSTSSVKFSRHLIFNIPNIAFATNIHAGNFVNMVCKKIRDWDKEKESVEVPGIQLSDIKNLFVMDAKKNRVLFCDEGVYTKNRNFRLYRSTKLGKNSPLIVAQENEYVPSLNSKLPQDEQLFQDSLVTLVKSSCKILTYGESGSKVKRPQTMNNENNCNFELDGFNKSPYPEIDSYIQSVVAPGYIRCWFYFSQGELLVYEIGNNRFCYNIGREHKSNGIMYVVNLKTATFYQKCHDPDCKDFRSDVWVLPESTVFWRNMGDDDQIEWIQSTEGWGSDDTGDNSSLSGQVEMDDITDEQLLRAVDAFEMWDMIDEITSSASSIQGSHLSSQSSLSQKSNPWDKLSMISSPGSSFMDDLSQPQSQELVHNQCLQAETQQETGSESYSSHEIECSQEFLQAVLAVEEQMFGYEMEFLS